MATKMWSLDKITFNAKGLLAVSLPVNQSNHYYIKPKQNQSVMISVH